MEAREQLGRAGFILMGAFVPVLHLACELVPTLWPWLHDCTKDQAGIGAFAASALGMIIGSLLKPASPSKA